VVESECEHGSGGMKVESDAEAGSAPATCPTGAPDGGSSSAPDGGTVAQPDPAAPGAILDAGCVVNADCGTGAVCVDSRCQSSIQ
jgi:hypothetical protein